MEDSTNLDRLREISERLTDTEFQLAQANALIAAIFNGSGEAIVAKDFDGIITAWNPAATRLYGWRREEAVGSNIRIIVPEHKHSEEDLIMDNVEQGIPTKLETERFCKDGRIINVKLTVSPIVASNGKIVGASSISHPASWEWEELEANE